ncbi:hypothetical protein H7U28_15030 [Coprobacillus cateniformis]|nr:hypothetical protein [Coprobacillus cateniformis]
MAQKRFVFDDEKETVQTQQSLSQIDQYENYKHSEEKKIIDKKETIPKIPKDSLSPQYSMKETREEPIPTMIHKKTKPQQTKLIETSKEEQPRNRSYSKKPRQKVKKKTKKKTKNKTKVIKEKKHRSWFSTLILFFISLCIIAGICVGGYVAYQYYLKQQDQINNLQNQLQDQEKTPTQDPTVPPVQDTPQDPEEQKPPQENQPTETPETTPQETPEDNRDALTD